MRLQKILLGLLSSIIALSSSGALCAAEPPEKGKIGAILPLSGEIAPLGAAVRNGMILGLRNLPEEAGRRLEIVFEDDGGLQKNTVNAFKKLTADRSIIAVVTASSGTSNAVAPLADRAGIPLIAVASDPAVSRARSHVVNLWVTPEEQVKILVSEIERRGYKSVAMVSAIHDGTLSFKSAFFREKPADVEVVFDEELSLEVRDFKTTISLMKSRPSIDAIFVNLFFGQTGLFARQVRELGVKAPLFAIEMFEDDNEVKNSGGALLDQWYVQADDPDDSFLNEYRKAFPGAATYAAANGHDAVSLIEAGTRNGSDALNGFLHTVKNFQGALGRYSATGDNRFTLPATVKVVTRRGFVKAAEED